MAELCGTTAVAVRGMKEADSVKSKRASRGEPVLRDPSAVLRIVFEAHGRRRYREGASEFNGACDLIQPSEAFERECAAGGPSSDIEGPGAVWAWFVGSPRAFTFGFVRSSSWATREMKSHLAAEFEAVRGGPHLT